jgi:hypothetical protein
MLSLSQLCSVIARVTRADVSHVDQVARCLQKAGYLPAYPAGLRNRPTGAQQIMATADHAVLLIGALMIADRPPDYTSACASWEPRASSAKRLMRPIEAGAIHRGSR